MERTASDAKTIVDGVGLDASERQECEVWTRVMGYYRPVSFFNTGKKGEWRERTPFDEPAQDMSEPEAPPELER